MLPITTLSLPLAACFYHKNNLANDELKLPLQRTLFFFSESSIWGCESAHVLAPCHTYQRCLCLCLPFPWTSMHISSIEWHLANSSREAPGVVQLLSTEDWIYWGEEVHNIKCQRLLYLDWHSSSQITHVLQSTYAQINSSSPSLPLLVNTLFWNNWVNSRTGCPNRELFRNSDCGIVSPE